MIRTRSPWAWSVTTWERGSATRSLASMMTGADVVVAVGNRTNQNGTDSWQLLSKDTTLIHIDIDPQEIGRNHEAVRLVGDARATLGALLDHVWVHAILESAPLPAPPLKDRSPRPGAGIERKQHPLPPRPRDR